MSCRKEPWWNKRAGFALLFGCLALLPAAGLAQSTSVIFERINIRIDPMGPAPVAPVPKDGKEAKPPAPRTSTEYNVEVRGEDALKLEYIHGLNTLTDATGVMIVFNVPSQVALPALHDYTAVDALFLSGDGTILQILPNVVLADLQESISAKQPVKAFLFLAAGQVAARHLLPRDVVAGSMFIPAPPLMQ